MTIELTNKENAQDVYVLRNCTFLTDWHYIPSYGKPNSAFVFSPSVVGVDEKDDTVRSLSLDFFKAREIK